MTEVCNLLNRIQQLEYQLRYAASDDDRRVLYKQICVCKDTLNRRRAS